MNDPMGKADYIAQRAGITADQVRGIWTRVMERQALAGYTPENPATHNMSPCFYTVAEFILLHSTGEKGWTLWRRNFVYSSAVAGFDHMYSVEFALRHGVKLADDVMADYPQFIGIVPDFPCLICDAVGGCNCSHPA